MRWYDEKRKRVSAVPFKKKRSFTSSAFAFAMLLLGFVTIVIPNSIRPLALTLLTLCGALALLSIKRIEFNARTLVWALSGGLTLVYVCVGWYQGYTAAIEQVIFVYIISPGLWLLVCSKVLRVYSPRTISHAVIFFGSAGGLSVFLYYYVFLNFGADALTWLIATPNLEYGEGIGAATMHVFGSLMFVSAGFFAAPKVLKSGVNKVVAGFIFLAAALLSGRSALILSLLIGLSVGLISMLRGGRGHSNSKQTGTVIGIFILLVILVMTTAQMYGFNVEQIADEFVQKISKGGGEDRVGQLHALKKGIQDSILLGAGHGVGTSVIRNDEFPWRYELLWVATLFRVGILGSLIYAVPVAIIFIRYFRLLATRRNSAESDFIFGGFLASFVGSATNPYYESFEFQWMLVLPFVYFILNGDPLKQSIKKYTALTREKL